MGKIVKLLRSSRNETEKGRERKREGERERERRREERRKGRREVGRKGREHTKKGLVQHPGHTSTPPRIVGCPYLYYCGGKPNCVPPSQTAMSMCCGTGP